MEIRRFTENLVKLSFKKITFEIRLKFFDKFELNKYELD